MGFRSVLAFAPLLYLQDSSFSDTKCTDCCIQQSEENPVLFRLLSSEENKGKPKREILFLRNFLPHSLRYIFGYADFV
ncbi:hypothetical protein QE152_g7746 [Popillia japonica]|uniref:Secreted protein n=1 Tax=Popillia japonica TaxID=7064 RepID=A0AAW1ME86_POPJA